MYDLVWMLGCGDSPPAYTQWGERAPRQPLGAAFERAGGQADFPGFLMSFALQLFS